MAKTYLEDFSSAGNLDGATSSDGLFGWGNSQIGSTGVKASGNVTFTQSDYVTDAECDTGKLYVYAVYVSHSGGGGWWIGLAKNSTYPGTGYLLNITSTDATLYRINSGAYNVIANASHTPSAGTYRLEYDESTGDLVGTKDGATIVTGNSTAEPDGSGFRKAMFGFDGGTNAVFSEFGYGDVVTATLEQEGFRFYEDDGDEDGSTASQAQDTNDTVALATARVFRALINATLDPGAIAYTLRAQKNGSGGYVAVPVGTTYDVTPDQPTSGTVTTVGTAADPWTINRATASTGDLVIFVIAWDDSTAVTAVTAPAGPNGETAVSIAGPVASNGTEMRMQAWYYIATGSWSTGTLSFDPNASETCRAVSFAIPTGQFNASDPIGFAGTDASAGTAESTINSPTGTAEADDGGGRLFIAYGSDADAITAHASGTTTINNSTGGGVGLCVVSRDAIASDSESVANITASIASDSWASLAFIVKPLVTTSQIYVATSTNFTDGTATTARLTAPSGKTSGADFEAGEIKDTGNAITLNLGSGKYTEVAWNLNTQSPAAGGDYWDLRVYAGSSPLDTYTVTGRLTLSGGGGSTVTKTATDTLMVTDLPVTRGFEMTLDDGLAPSDAGIRGIMRGRFGNDSALLSDQIFRLGTRGRLVADSAVLADQAQTVRELHRLAGDALVLVDTLIKQLSGSNLITKVMTDGLVLIDDFAKQLRRVRLAEDSFATADGLLSAASRNRQGSDSVSIADQSLKSWLRGRTATENVTVIDQALRTVSRLREFADAIEVTDDSTTVRLRTRLVSDTSGLSDQLIKSLSAFVQYTYEVRIQIGVTPSGIVVGVSQPVLLGSESPIVLGGYN